MKAQILYSLFVSLIVTLASQVQGENILFLLPVSSKSHRNVFDPLAKALAQKGHKITVVSSMAPSKPIHPNVKELVPVEIFQRSVDYLGNPLKLREKGILGMMTMDMSFVEEGCRELYEHPDFMALTQGNFSLVLIDMILNDCLYGFVHELNVPFVIISTLAAPSYVVEQLGLRLPPSFVPSPFFELGDKMTFMERLTNICLNILIDFMNHFLVMGDQEAVYRQYLGQDTPGVFEIMSNASMLFMNSHFTLTYLRPNLPDMIEIGGLHCGPANPLPNDLEEFVNGAKDGFILFSLGSIVQGQHMTEQVRKTFLNVFSRLKQRVVWKWETESMPDLPPNVKLVKWAPQQSLLAHPNIKVFITHGGLLSVQESTYHAVPIIGIPIFGDQDLNIRKAEGAGYGLFVEILTVTEESLGHAIDRVLNEKSFSEKVKELSVIFRDQSESPLDRALYWTEYLLRHKGAKHLRSPARDLNFIQYHSLDTLGVLALVVILILWMLKSLVMLFVRKIFDKKNINEKKNQ